MLVRTEKGFQIIALKCPKGLETINCLEEMYPIGLETINYLEVSLRTRLNVSFCYLFNPTKINPA